MMTSVWMPRSRRSRSRASAAFGTRPSPTWIVEPSSMIPAMYAAICSATSSACGCVYSTTGVSFSTRRSMRERWIAESPKVKGMFGLTSAMMRRAWCSTLCVMSTEMPRLTKPLRSGAETWTSATSTGKREFSSRKGSWKRESGM